MFSLSNATISQIATISSRPIPQITPFGGSFIPNIQFNTIISSLTDMNRFVMALPSTQYIQLPQLAQPKLDVTHCTPVFNGGEGPPIMYELNKSDPIPLNALKSHHNAINEAVFSTDEPLHPLLYAPSLKVMEGIKTEIDKYCE
jgi:hypothetical protein